MKFYTVGYGGRTPRDFLDLLIQHDITTVVDVRLRPDKAHLGSFARAKTPDKGIERLLGEAEIGYVSLVELGNLFLGSDDWRERYQRLLDQAGDLLTERLFLIPGPICLLCAEKCVEDCHRRLIADYLVGRGHQVEYIE